MRLAAIAIAGLFVALSAIAEAQEKRVALIVGNDAYKGLPKLNNAVADARAMDKKLKELGFETILRTNAGRTEMGRAIAEFGNKIGTPDTVGLVFYSGHGIQAFERNWLVPIDANLESDVDLQTEAIDAQRILSAMDDARNPLNIVILDACRDNPLPKKGRSAARGLSVVSVAPRGSVIAYSASPNQKADDGNPGSNGVYTAELLKALDEPGLKIEDVFKRANGGVQSATGGRQVPWFNASIQGDFYFRPGTLSAVTTTAAQPGQPTRDPTAVELVFWNSISDSADVADFEEYLNKYPKGQFAGLARNKIRALGAKQQIAAVIPSPQAGPVQVRPAQPAVGTYDLSPGKTFRDCQDCPEMIVIPAGNFLMGSPSEEQDRKSNEGPQHNVTILSFALGKIEVTFAQYDACTAERACPRVPDNNWGRGDRPAINVSWDDAKQYTAWLTRKTGKGYRLPSEAEWEYAARAGTTSRFSCGDNEGCLSQVAWYYANSLGRTQSTGSKEANYFGLYDLIGNVWEWTEDCYNDGYRGRPTDGSTWKKGDCKKHPIRGGSWNHTAAYVRSAARLVGSFGDRSSNGGFRLARDLN